MSVVPRPRNLLAVAVAIAAAALLAACSEDPSPAPRPVRPARQSSLTGPQAYSAMQSGREVDYSALSCDALSYLADRYERIADNASSIANGDSPAAQAAQLTAIQASSKSIAFRNMIIQKGGC